MESHSSIRRAFLEESTGRRGTIRSVFGRKEREKHGSPMTAIRKAQTRNDIVIVDQYKYKGDDRESSGERCPSHLRSTMRCDYSQIGISS